MGGLVSKIPSNNTNNCSVAWLDFEIVVAEIIFYIEAVNRNFLSFIMRRFYVHVGGNIFFNFSCNKKNSNMQTLH